MNISKRSLFSLALSAALVAGCTKNVTNNVPGSNILTDSARNQSNSNPSNTSGGGVINGGGGRGVRCHKNGKTTVEVLDLYEAKRIYKLNLLDLGKDEEKGKEKFVELLLKHFMGDRISAQDAEQSKKYYRKELVDHFVENMRFIDKGQHLRLLNDSYEPTLEQNCEAVQIAHYYDESILIVDRELWDQLDVTNKIGLIAHEAFYFYVRQSGVTNSMTVRKLVGRMLSVEGIRPLSDGVPHDDENKAIYCSSYGKGADDLSFTMFESLNKEGTKGIELVVSSLGTEMSLFRTAAFFENVNFNGLLEANPTFLAEDGKVARDTYSPREVLALSEAKRTSTNTVSLKAELQNAAYSKVLLNTVVQCQIPQAMMPVKVTEPSEYIIKKELGNDDIVKIAASGIITLEQTRQVGGSGGVGNLDLPYPTVCRTRESGLVIEQNEKEVIHSVLKVTLVDNKENSANCGEYVRKYSEYLTDSIPRFTLTKEYYTKVK